MDAGGRTTLEQLPGRFILNPTGYWQAAAPWQVERTEFQKRIKIIFNRVVANLVSCAEIPVSSIEFNNLNTPWVESAMRIFVYISAC